MDYFFKKLRESPRRLVSTAYRFDLQDSFRYFREPDKFMVLELSDFEIPSAAITFVIRTLKAFFHLHRSIRKRITQIIKRKNEKV